MNTAKYDRDMKRKNPLQQSEKEFKAELTRHVQKTVDKDVMIKLLQSLVREMTKKHHSPYLVDHPSKTYNIPEKAWIAAIDNCIQIMKDRIKTLKNK
jgi:hypothetical protein